MHVKWSTYTSHSEDSGIEGEYIHEIGDKSKLSDSERESIAKNLGKMGVR